MLDSHQRDLLKPFSAVSYQSINTVGFPQVFFKKINYQLCIKLNYNRWDFKGDT